MIELKDINFSYREKTALKDINLKIESGESIAIIGPNGSGKSTFLKFINGLVFSKSGEYRFKDELINEKRLKDADYTKDFHKQLGFVFQNSDTQLFCSTVYDEIAFGPLQFGLNKDEVEKRVYDCMELLEVKSLRDDTPYNLSGGEKKRVAIASVLAVNPDVIILDEPMNGISPKGKKFLKDLLMELNKIGKTIICATHDFNYVDGLFKRAIVFSEENTIIRDGDYNEVINDMSFLEDNNII